MAALTCATIAWQAKALLLPWHLIKVWLAGSMNVLVALFHLMVSFWCMRDV
jgi:hypothetical protein